MTCKQFVAKLEEAGIHCDKVVAHRDGSFEFRNGYFYPHRKADAQRLELARAAFPAAEVKQHDHFASWPSDSWIATVVRFQEVSA